MARRLIPAAALFLLIAFPLAAQNGTKRTGAELKAELEAMFDSDQSLLKEIIEARKKYGSDDHPETAALLKRQGEINRRNIEALAGMIDESGWPGLSAVGEKASNGAFLVLQHSDLPYQKKYLPLFRAAVAAGEARPWHLGLLEDRALVREGKKQLYGSQWRRNAQGVMEPYPIEDEANLDARRAGLRMRPMAEEAADYGVEYRPRGRIPD